MDKIQQQWRQLTKAIDAINHPLRYRMIEIIKAEPNGIKPTDIALIVQNDTSLKNINRNKYMVSQHLTILKAADLVTLRIDGKSHFYSANLEKIMLLHFLRKEWSKYETDNKKKGHTLRKKNK